MVRTDFTEIWLSKDENNAQELLGLVPAEDLNELKAFAEECLKKAGLTELSEKMKTLHK